MKTAAVFNGEQRGSASSQPLLPQNIVLVGFMGSGKSTVGRILARNLGWRYVDTDALVRRTTGQEIPALFAEKGEAFFRDRETEAILGTSVGQEQVIATGGGAVLREENVAALRGAGLVVWLTARPEVVAARTERRAAARPILASAAENGDLLTHILKLLGERGPRYQAAAHLIVDTSDRTPEIIAREVARKAERWEMR